MKNQAVLVLAAASLAISQTIDSNNCNGVFFVDSQYTDGACCVGGDLNLVLSSCPGWPICTGPATTSQGPQTYSCATVIPSDADYSNNLAMATSSLSASGTNYITTFVPGEEGSAPTASSSPSASSESSDSSSDSSDSSESSVSSASSDADATNTADGAAASATGDNGAAKTMAGISAVGGAVLMLAVLL